MDLRKRRRARGRGARSGKSREMRLTHICCCCLLYQLGVLSNGSLQVSSSVTLGLLSSFPSQRPGTHGSPGLATVRGEQGLPPLLQLSRFSQRAAIKKKKKKKAVRVLGRGSRS